MRILASSAMVLVALSGGGTVALALLGADVYLAGGLVRGRTVWVGLAAVIIACVLRYWPTYGARRRLLSGSRPILGGMAAVTVACAKLAAVGYLAIVFAISCFNPVRVDPDVRVLLHPGKGVNEYLYRAELLGAAREIRSDRKTRSRFDSPELERFLDDLPSGPPTSADLERFWGLVVGLRPLNDRVAELQRAVAGRAFEHVLVIAAGPPGPSVRPWPIDARTRCEWINLALDATPAATGDKVTVLSLRLGNDPAVKRFVSLTLSVPPSQQPPVLVLTDEEGQTTEVRPSGRMGPVVGYRTLFPPTRSVRAAQLQSSTGLKHGLPPLRLPGKCEPGVLRVRLLGTALEDLKSWPVLAQHEKDRPIEWNQHNAQVTWILGPIAPQDRARFPGPVVEIVPAVSLSTTEPARLERGARYLNCPLRGVFPTAGVEGWAHVGAGLSHTGEVLAESVGEGQNPRREPILVRQEPRWLTLALPPVALWSESGNQEWFSGPRRLAASQLLIIASSLAHRQGRAEPEAIMDEVFVRAEEGSRPLLTGLTRPEGSIREQFVRALQGHLDAAPAEEPENTIRPDCARWGLVDLVGLLAVVVCFSAVSRWHGRRQNVQEV